jgi:hypothetical protein
MNQCIPTTHQCCLAQSLLHHQRITCIKTYWRVDRVVMNWLPDWSISPTSSPITANFDLGLRYAEGPPPCRNYQTRAWPNGLDLQRVGIDRWDLVLSARGYRRRFERHSYNSLTHQSTTTLILIKIKCPVGEGVKVDP